MVFRFPTPLCCSASYEQVAETGGGYPDKTHTADCLTHLCLPFSSFGWPLGDEDEIGPSPSMRRIRNPEKNRRGYSLDVRYTSHQSQPTAIPTHYFEHKRSLVGGSRGVYAIDCLTDSVQRGRGTNRQIGHGHIVVDRPDEPNNLEVAMLGKLSFRNLACAGG